MNRNRVCAVVTAFLVLGSGLASAQEIDPGGDITPGPDLTQLPPPLPPTPVTVPTDNLPVRVAVPVRPARPPSPPQRVTPAVPALCPAAQCAPPPLPTLPLLTAAAGRAAGKRWADLGHWTWIHSTSRGHSSGEVYYEPSATTGERFPDGQVIRDVWIKVRPNLDLHRRDHIDRSGIDFVGHTRWRLAIECSGGRWVRYYRLQSSRYHRGPVQVPFAIAPGSVASTLEGRVCR